MIIKYIEQTRLRLRILQYKIARELNKIILMRFMDKKFNIGDKDCYGKFVVSLFKITVD